MGRHTIDDMRQLAADHDGQCLSKEYRGADKELSWMCSRGHTWDALPDIVRQGGWCRQCLGRAGKKLTIEEMHAIAAERNGKCLSTVYKDWLTYLEWECRFGHRWLARPGHVKNKGSWCPHCAHKAPLTIELMRELAQARGGKCISTVYRGSHEKLIWQCSKGHRWKAEPSKIRIGHWCSHHDCRYARSSAKLRGDIRELKAIAKARGGKLLSTEYLNRNAPLQWQCASGHRWAANASNIKFGPTWCPQCPDRKKNKEKYRAQVASLSGKYG